MRQPLKHILCVDDEEDILAILRLCIEDVGGLKATCINDVERAILNVSSIKPDLVLLDVMMPKMNGLVALHHIHRPDIAPTVPVVLMTARVQPKEIEEYMANGAMGVIAKPFDPMKLMENLQAIWDKIDG